MLGIWIPVGLFALDALVVVVVVVATLVQERRRRPPGIQRVAEAIGLAERRNIRVVTYDSASGATKEQAVAIAEKAWPGSRIVDTDLDTLLLRDANRRSADWN